MRSPYCLAKIRTQAFDAGIMTARMLALFIGMFTLMNLFGNAFWPGFGGNLWWISFGHVLPGLLAESLLAIFAVTLVTFAFRKRLRRQRSPIVAAQAVAFAFVALVNTVGFYRMVVRGQIDARFPLPFSLAICAGLLVIARSAWLEPKVEGHGRWWLLAAGSASLFALFPLALMLFFGNTDYRCPADAVVVFGARTFADGRLSDALQDRIRTACELYRAGLARRLVLSGGRGDGPVTEAEAMRGYALKHGVRAEDIFIDNQGVNTEATVRNTTPLFKQWHTRRVLAVSHFYHLPRIKLAYERAGVDVCTVPAPQGRLLLKMPYNMAREVAAFWAYYLKDRPTAAAKHA
jgi:uncharacterized SAM-binding protein YcdF (DUF218 family)